jgi:hypothetical protein
MLGSTFFAATDPARVARIATLDDIDDFPHVHMDRMLTLDFEVLASAAGLEWSEKTPVLFDEEDGWAVFKINESGLRYIISHTADAGDEHADDLRKLAEFVRSNGDSSIYESSTF